MARPRSCTCGQCKRCRDAARKKAAWDAMSPEQRRQLVQRRDPIRRQLATRKHARRHAAKHPDKTKARKTVAYALRTGTLVKGPCEFSGPACAGRIEAHHDDYSKPLEVRWVCQYHHPQIEKIGGR